MRSNIKRFDVLDGMRGIAALSVMIFHYTINNDMLTWPKNIFFINAYFILSGFVISYSYGDRVYATMTAKEYLLRRFIRLYLLFILGFVAWRDGSILLGDVYRSYLSHKERPCGACLQCFWCAIIEQSWN